MQIPTQNLSDNKSTSSNFVRSSHESSNTNPLVINTNDATKGKSDEISKLNKWGWTKLQNVEDEKSSDDNIPLNKIYKHHHTTKTKH